MIAAIYARKSTSQPDVADVEKSVTRQIALAKAFAAERGWQVIEEYVDDGISGQEIPGGAAFAAADHQPQGRVSMVGMRDFQGEDTGFHPAGMATVPHGALLPTAFANGDAPGFAAIALGIIELVVSTPAQHETQAKGQQDAQPER